MCRLFSFNSWLAGSFVEKPRRGYQPSLQASTAHGPCITHSGYSLQGAQKALLTKVVKNSGIQASAFCIGRQVEQIVVFRSKLERHNAMLPRKACEPRSGLQMERSPRWIEAFKARPCKMQKALDEPETRKPLQTTKCSPQRPSAVSPWPRTTRSNPACQGAGLPQAQLSKGLDAVFELSNWQN